MTTQDARTATSAGAEPVVARYAVAGMTCGHCVDAVRQEVGALEGVTGVEVDLVAAGTSTLRVTSAAPLRTEEVAAAVDEAGYDLVQQG